VDVTGPPPFAFSWYKDGVLLQDDGHFTGTQTNILGLRGVRLTDVGNYQLTVSNNNSVVTSAVARVTAHYVDAACTNSIAPYMTWSTAAANVQDAINAAQPGELVFVTNGVYTSGGKSMDGVITNRASVDKAMIV